ncbi:unnamed protein product [Pipistrellus nathusii]|uniref:Uncharacterized protein n=1 Tax=Pipistrellus nathusii TaxID=59473 RepID=A0ABN9ZL24_PIPNA
MRPSRAPPGLMLSWVPVPLAAPLPFFFFFVFPRARFLLLLLFFFVVSSRGCGLLGLTMGRGPAWWEGGRAGSGAAAAAAAALSAAPRSAPHRLSCLDSPSRDFRTHPPASQPASQPPPQTGESLLHHYLSE